MTADGRPHLVPCCFALSGDTIYSAIDHKPKSTCRLQRLENLRTNPNASLLVDHYADDWSTLWWVRADGTGRILDDGVESGGGDRVARGEVQPVPGRPARGPGDRDRRHTWRGWP